MSAASRKSQSDKADQSSTTENQTEGANASNGDDSNVNAGNGDANSPEQTPESDPPQVEAAKNESEEEKSDPNRTAPVPDLMGGGLDQPVNEDTDYNPYADPRVPSSFVAAQIAKEIEGGGDTPTLDAVNEAHKDDDKDKDESKSSEGDDK